MAEMTREQREQAAVVIEEFQNSDHGRGGKVGVALDAAIAALRGPQPDPSTGLVPCGCGRKADVIEDTMDAGRIGYAVGCRNCTILTGWFNTLEIARTKWNLSHGYKEADDNG